MDENRESSQAKARLGAGLLLAIAVGVVLAASLGLLCRSNQGEPCLSLDGKNLYSQDNEELIIRDFFSDREGGVFVDVGANDYRINSTTFYLEEHLGWGGIAVDALPRFASDYSKYRPNTQFFSFFVSNRSEDKAKFFVNKSNDRVSSHSNSFSESHGGELEEREVATITLNDLLAGLGVERIDLLSMDIELAEPAALAGFDIQRYQPSLVCIEAHEAVRKEILEYFEVNDYKIVEKYLPFDDRNLYFTPVRLPKFDPVTETN